VTDGDVLDAGELTLKAEAVKSFTQGMSNRKVRASVEPSATAALAEAARLRPDLATKLHTTFMTLADNGALVIAKCKLEAADKVLPKDGSSNLPDVVAQNPAAGPLIATLGSATSEAQRCVPEGAPNDKQLTAVAGAAAAVAK
jgi:hypothetical protein